MEIFAKYIEKCPNIESLNLQGNALGSSSAELISVSLAKSDSIKYFNLQYNKITTTGAIVKVT
jgi:Leucine-rich repeat (LRR) protein